MALPWRERVEVFAVNADGTVLGGRYEGDKTFGVFGGGVEPGETFEAAAKREFWEESGFTLFNVGRIPVPPLYHEWGHDSGGVRRKEFCGSKTVFYAGHRENTKSREGESGLTNIRQYSIDEALKIQLSYLKDYHTPIRLMHRILCLVWLQHNLPK